MPLTQGLSTLVDDYVFGAIGHLKWHASKKGSVVYAQRNVGTEHGRLNVYLHHCVIGMPLDGFVVDHVDGNGLNNQLKNLRVVSYARNLQNSYRHRAGRLFGAELAPSGHWRAQVTVAGKRLRLGTFETREEAHEAAVKASLKVTTR